jgi:hypothetical protein
MSTQTRRLSAALAPLVLLAPTACSEESEPEGDTAEQSTHAVAVAADFFEPTPEWSAPVPEGARVFPLGEHLVWHSPETGSIGAYDASGAEVWSAELPSFGIVDEDDIEDDFRIVDSQTVAVVQLGTTEDDGLDAGESVYRIWLYDVASGPVGEPVDVPAEMRELGEYGLAFTALDDDGEPTPLEPSYTVSASGEAAEHQPVNDTLAETPVAQTPTMTVGDVPVFGIAGVPSESSTYGTIEGDFSHGFGGEGWNSMDIAPSSAPDGGVNAGIVTAATEQYVVASWADGDVAFWEEEEAGVLGLVDVANGEFIAELSCESELEQAYFFDALDSGVAGLSADGGYLMTGQAVVDTQSGEIRCVESERSVLLQAVDGQGRAFGSIDEDAEDAETFMLGADGEVTASPTGPEVDPPFGFLEGDLAVHYDSDSSIVTANRLKV